MTEELDDFAARALPDGNKQAAWRVDPAQSGDAGLKPSIGKALTSVLAMTNAVVTHIETFGTSALDGSRTSTLGLRTTASSHSRVC